MTIIHIGRGLLTFRIQIYIRGLFVTMCARRLNSNPPTVISNAIQPNCRCLKRFRSVKITRRDRYYDESSSSEMIIGRNESRLHRWTRKRNIKQRKRSLFTVHDGGGRPKPSKKNRVQHMGTEKNIFFVRKEGLHEAICPAISPSV